MRSPFPTCLNHARLACEGGEATLDRLLAGADRERGHHVPLQWQHPSFGDHLPRDLKRLPWRELPDGLLQDHRAQLLCRERRCLLGHPFFNTLQGPARRARAKERLPGLRCGALEPGGRLPPCPVQITAVDETFAGPVLSLELGQLPALGRLPPPGPERSAASATSRLLAETHPTTPSAYRRS